MGDNMNLRLRRKRRRPCSFCVEKTDIIDYKYVDKFTRFISDRGKITPRRNSGVCAKHQRVLALAIKRARFMGLIPYCVD
ncbi:MAG: 30S ribosomal protein S18 [Candidatus Margulisiibacteriota bacterium]|jgi:small subunit ribosomal protein S18